MKPWMIPLTSFLVGLALGISGTIVTPRLAGPYLPAGILRPAKAVEGSVLAKQREAERLLLTLATRDGAILVTFTQRVAEIDLLVAQGDLVSVALPRYEPFVEDPVIQRVRKPKPQPEGS